MTLCLWWLSSHHRGPRIHRSDTANRCTKTKASQTKTLLETNDRRSSSSFNFHAFSLSFDSVSFRSGSILPGLGYDRKSLPLLTPISWSSWRPSSNLVHSSCLSDSHSQACHSFHNWNLGTFHLNTFFFSPEMSPFSIEFLLPSLSEICLYIG